MTDWILRLICRWFGHLPEVQGYFIGGTLWRCQSCEARGESMGRDIFDTNITWRRPYTKTKVQ